jgi:hypothetical protein
MLRLGICLLLLVVAAATATPLHRREQHNTGAAVLNPSTRTWAYRSRGACTSLVGGKVTTSNCVDDDDYVTAAVASFSDKLNVTGWGVLNVETRGKHGGVVISDVDQFYAAVGSECSCDFHLHSLHSAHTKLTLDQCATPFLQGYVESALTGNEIAPMAHNLFKVGS